MKRDKNFVDDNNLLYLVATPIGNLKELPDRAIEVLSSMDIIACEDTRNTHSLLSHFNIQKNLFSLREHNEKSASQQVIKYINEGKKVAYVSDAGYPGISDPGHILVEECLKNNIRVSVVNGSSAFTNALVASGLNTDHFYFYGFLSSKDVEAKKQLEGLVSIKDTLIFYESPHRIERTIKLLQEAYPNRNAVIARELTKKNEEFIRGNLDELADLDFSTLLGEMVVVVEGNNNVEAVDEKLLKKHLEILLDKGMSKKDAAEAISKIDNVSKNALYDMAINMKK